MIKRWWRSARPRVLSAIAYGLVRVTAGTARLKIDGMPEDPSNALFGGWHGKSLLFANLFRRRKFWVIISHSNDGEIQSQIFRRLGFQIIRGSTGRGGVRAAVEGIRVLKAGGTMAMTPDGPRGPSGIVQGGIMLMAHKSGGRLFPVGSSARPCVRFNSWDRYMIPLPFARAQIVIGPEITIPSDADEATIEEIRLKFQQAIHDAEAEADRRLGYVNGR